VRVVDDDERRRILGRILAAEPSSLREDIRTSRGVPWDAAEPVVILTADALLGVLAKHEAGVLTDDDLEAWADAVEAREDVGFEPAGGNAVRQCLFELSSPTLTGKSVAQLSADWRARLTS
jgi:hypothetical protein